MNIAVPANHEDCYNLQEYLMWNIRIDVMSRHCEETIDNPHVDKNDQNILHPELYIILHKNIPSFNKLPVSEIPFTSSKIYFDNDD
jgi:hypothetical protein